ncbi:MAG: hypothetical protein OHK0031_04040 [Anaerolineales bacterium]
MTISSEFITSALSFIFTLLVFSYLIGDNPLFRVAVHIFVGLSAGYVAVVLWQQVIVNKLIAPMMSGGWQERALLLIPLLMSGLLLGKISPRYQAWGRPVVAYLLGVGAAVAIGGALLGTLLPQAQASIALFDLSAGNKRPLTESLFEAVFILLGTISTLAYFQFTVLNKNGKRPAIFSVLGQIFIAITFGVLFAGALTASLSALIDRAAALVNFFDLLFLSL